MIKLVLILNGIALEYLGILKKYTVCNTSEINLPDILKKIGNFDLVFETTGIENIIDDALKSIRIYGRIVSIAERYNMSYDNLLAQGKQFRLSILHILKKKI